MDTGKLVPESPVHCRSADVDLILTWYFFATFTLFSSSSPPLFTLFFCVLKQRLLASQTHLPVLLSLQVKLHRPCPGVVHDQSLSLPHDLGRTSPPPSLTDTPQDPVRLQFVINGTTYCLRKDSSHLQPAKYPLQNHCLVIKGLLC